MFSSRRHTAVEQPSEVVVRYPYHPFAGRSVAVRRRVTHAGQVHYSIEGPDKHPVLLPAWMTESTAAALAIVEVPRLPLDPLRALHSLIEAQRAPSPSEMIRIDGGDSGTASTMATTRSSSKTKWPTRWPRRTATNSSGVCAASRAALRRS